MSIIGHSKLDSIITHTKLKDPGEILNQLEVRINEALALKQYTTESKDGMDIGICTFDVENKTMKYAGAFRSLLIINENDITEIKVNRFPIREG
jgi:hypothetical protein